MKFILQIAAGSVLGFLLIVGICSAAWHFHFRDALYHWRGGIDTEIAVHRENEAEKEGTEEGEKGAAIMWSTNNKAEWNETPHPNVIVGIDANWKMTVIGKGNQPFASEAEAQKYMHRVLEEKYPDTRFVVAAVQK